MVDRPFGENCYTSNTSKQNCTEKNSQEEIANEGIIPRRD